MDLDLDTVDPRKLSAARFRELLAAGAPTDRGAVSPEAFARLISLASTEQLDAVNAEPAIRARVLDEIFARMRQQFRADRGADTRAVVHWRIGDRPGGGHDEFQMVIDRGTCTTSSTTDRAPRVSLQVGAVNFLRLITGNGSPTMMFMTGKLTIRGDLPFAAGLLGLFDMPRPPTHP